MAQSKTSQPGPEDLLALLPNVSRETIALLSVYEDLLKKWSGVKNLVARSTLENVWTRHFADSLQLLAYAKDAKKWADLGSGAGFPGLVIAIALASQGGAEVHLIESDNRKCAFLREVARETRAPAIVHHGRIEDETWGLQGIEIVTARALAPIGKLLDMAKPLLETGARGLFQKGRDVDRELTEATICSNFHIKISRNPMISDGCVVSVDPVT